MPMYEFECPRGHVVSDLVEMGTKEIICPTCLEANRGGMNTYLPNYAQRILSPTRTTFEFADNRRKKSIT